MVNFLFCFCCVVCGVPFWSGATGGSIGVIVSGGYLDILGVVLFGMVLMIHPIDVNSGGDGVFPQLPRFAEREREGRWEG